MEEIKHLINRIAMNENNSALTDREKLEKKENILQTVSKLGNWEIMEANNALRYFEEPEEIDAI